MDFKELFKKFWFVILMAIALLAFVVYYGIDYIKNNTPEVASKVVDGKTVIYSIDDENYYADDLYETLYATSGKEIAYNILKKDVISNSIKTTPEMETTAANYAAYILQNYDEKEILSFVKQSGYNKIEDLSNLYLDQLKENEFVTSFLNENADKYITPVKEENDVRKISHILIKVADVTESEDENGNVIHTANPTDEEKTKLDTVLEELKTRTFEEVATDHSEDGSATNGGLLGLVGSNNSSMYVKEFADKSMELKPGEVSEVITTTYGYHILKCDEASNEDLLGDETFYSLISANSTNDINKLIDDKAKEMGIEVKDENLLAYMEDLLNGSEVSE